MVTTPNLTAMVRVVDSRWENPASLFCFWTVLLLVDWSKSAYLLGVFGDAVLFYEDACTDRSIDRWNERMALR